MNLKVSVIMPVYNVDLYIKKAIHSVLEQSYTNFELIIIDDCSSDQTVELIKEIQDSRIRLFINETNRGVSFCRNLAIHKSKGDWIAIMDGDDWWEPNRLEKLIPTLIEQSADIIGDNLNWFIDGKEKPYTTQFKKCGFQIKRPMRIETDTLINYDFGNLKPIIRKQFLEGNRLRYREKFKCGEDFIILFDCLQNGATMIVYPEALYNYRLRNNSVVSNKQALFSVVLDITNKLIQEMEEKKQKNIQQKLIQRKRKIRTILTFITWKQHWIERKVIRGTVFLLKNPVLYSYIASRMLTKIK